MREVEQGKEKPACQNCDFEEYCNHCLEGICGRWRPDLEYSQRNK